MQSLADSLQLLASTPHIFGDVQQQNIGESVGVSQQFRQLFGAVCRFIA